MWPFDKICEKIEKKKEYEKFRFSPCGFKRGEAFVEEIDGKNILYILVSSQKYLDSARNQDFLDLVQWEGYKDNLVPNSTFMRRFSGIQLKRDFNKVKITSKVETRIELVYPDGTIGLREYEADKISESMSDASMYYISMFQAHNCSVPIISGRQGGVTITPMINIQLNLNYPIDSIKVEYS
uniref:Uncharacterized protein n=1 Tax=Ochrobactrum phage ORM_20 TaxID=2985243 RepID=A0A9N6WZG2_9VIRU|nr:hypothetical protein ORM20_00106 [Ochrobactrum phage ORM_20]